jgi:hypothetical protein
LGVAAVGECAGGGEEGEGGDGGCELHLDCLSLFVG